MHLSWWWWLWWKLRWWWWLFWLILPACLYHIGRQNSASLIYNMLYIMTSFLIFVGDGGDGGIRGGVYWYSYYNCVLASAILVKSQSCFCTKLSVLYIYILNIMGHDFYLFLYFLYSPSTISKMSNALNACTCSFND